MFRQFKADDMLFVEYLCVVQDELASLWADNNYLVYTIKGKKGIRVLDQEYKTTAGDAFFVKKGAYTTHQFFDEQYISLIIFLPDEFIKRVMQKYQLASPERGDFDYANKLIHLDLDDVLSSYFQSVLSYFSHSKDPPRQLLVNKFEEFIINIMASSKNRPLIDYFNEICRSSKVSLRAIMEANFQFNMTFEDFARLSGRSLSTFRRDFIRYFGTTPGKWLRDRRLEYGRHLLETTNMNITEITYEVGFENPAHFVRIFKEKYDVPPLKYRRLL